MKKKLRFILMADIIGSRKAKQAALMESFRKVISVINEKAGAKILSPLTITLGDEFQGVLVDLPSALEVIISIEEEIINKEAEFKLRYVLLEGEIDTPINKRIAHEMLGAGLTEARSLLSLVKGAGGRFFVKLTDDEQSAAFNNLLKVYQRIIDDWQIEKDFEVVNLFLKHKDYKLVAEKLMKTRSQMWKRERSIKINEYQALKEVILYLSKK